MDPDKTNPHEEDISLDEVQHSDVADEPSSPLPNESAERSPTTNILILGPTGSGKPRLINMFSKEKAKRSSQGMRPRTTDFWNPRPLWISSRPFRLIDSPDFNTKSLSSASIFKKMVNYLHKMRHHYHAELSGILYLHPEGSDLESDRLKRDIGAVKNLFGDSWLPNIVIAVVGDPAPSDIDTIRRLQDPPSPFHPLCAGGAKIRPLIFQPLQIKEVLLDFDSKNPPEPEFYSKITFKPDVGGFDMLDELVDRALGLQAHGSNRSGQRPPRITLEESESVRQQLQLSLTEAEAELKSLRAQLEQTRSEYGSLRSELQLHDNTEQNKIVDSLKSLNRDIEDFGRSVAQYLVDNHIAANSDNLTTLPASNLSELKAQFGHKEGSPSLIGSPDGTSMPAEDFIDLALRSILCQRLYEHVFLPFHPILSTTSESELIASLYEEVRRHAPSTVAAKWRANTFIALSRSKDMKTSESVINNQVESIVLGDISKLFDSFFGQSNGVQLTEQQYNCLKSIVVSAWELNSVLKGDVVMLGDFQPMFHQRGAQFSLENMLEFEPDKRRKTLPEVSICTIGLGLFLLYSKAQGDGPEPVVVYKSTVVTERVYAL